MLMKKKNFISRLYRRSLSLFDLTWVFLFYAQARFRANPRDRKRKRERRLCGNYLTKDIFDRLLELSLLFFHFTTTAEILYSYFLKNKKCDVNINKQLKTTTYREEIYYVKFTPILLYLYLAESTCKIFFQIFTLFDCCSFWFSRISDKYF